MIRKIYKVFVFCLILAPSQSQAGLSDLRSYTTWAAVKVCQAATFNCATRFEVKAGHSNHVTGSCHYVNKAVDVYGSNECLNAFAVCLTAQPYVLYCYKNWGIGGILNWMDEGKCTPSNHQTHVHVQPLMGCRGDSRDDSDE